MDKICFGKATSFNPFISQKSFSLSLALSAVYFAALNINHHYYQHLHAVLESITKMSHHFRHKSALRQKKKKKKKKSDSQWKKMRERERGGGGGERERERKHFETKREINSSKQVPLEPQKHMYIHLEDIHNWSKSMGESFVLSLYRKLTMPYKQLTGW